MSCGCNNKPYETQYIGDVQVDALSTLPEYLLAERDVEDELSGDIVRSLVRVPTKRIIPSANFNAFTLAEDPDWPIEVPTGQIRSGYLTVDDGVIVPRYGYSGYTPYAQYVYIGKDGDKLICQSTGIVTFPEGHEYKNNIGVQYFASDTDGEPTTDSTSKFTLFVPISETEILLNIGAYIAPSL